MTPITQTPLRRVEPVCRPQCTSRSFTQPINIPFADYLEMSNRLNTDKPFWEQNTNKPATPESPKSPSKQPRLSLNLPKIGDVSPVQNQRVTQNYHAVMHFKKTLNLGSIVDITS